MRDSHRARRPAWRVPLMVIILRITSASHRVLFPAHQLGHILARILESIRAPIPPPLPRVQPRRQRTLVPASSNTPASQLR